MTRSGAHTSQDNMSMSNSASTDTVTCFLCKSKIPKKEALTHSQTCKKMGGTTTATKIENSSKRNYSPIKETTEDEEGKYSSSEHYSSSKFEESSSRAVSTSQKTHQQSKIKVQDKFSSKSANK